MVNAEEQSDLENASESSGPKKKNLYSKEYLYFYNL